MSFTGGSLVIGTVGRPDLIAPFAGAAILGAWDGNRLAAKVPGAALRRIFAYTLFAVAAFPAIDVFA